MFMPVPQPRPSHAPEPPALVHVIARSDLMWNRPLFKAPPLVVRVPKIDTALMVDDVRWGSRNQK